MVQLGRIPKTKTLRSLLATHYQIIGVLLGALLIALSTGTYTNWDAQIEFEAASNIINHGFPTVTTGLMINQPPLGFYLNALIFKLTGVSYQTGVLVVASFGLGCIIAIYTLGLILYNKTTGLVAAALFSIIPWHVYLSKIFLIDNQYLFFSLLALIVGIQATKKNSEKYLLISGILFAVAFMTKLFAIFTFIPLLLIIYLKRKENKFKLTNKKVLLFFTPSIILQVIWYGGIANQNFFGVYFSSDFTHPVLVTNPSLLFLPIVLAKSAGWFLLISVFTTIAISWIFRKLLTRQLWSDITCLTTVGCVACIDLLLVLGFHLTVPYISVIKYNYFALPFLCLLAASLTQKTKHLLKNTKPKTPLETAKLLLAGLSLTLLLASLVESNAFLVKWHGFVSFGVDSVIYYPLNPYSTTIINYYQELHYAALIILIATLTVPLIIKRMLKKTGAIY